MNPRSRVVGSLATALAGSLALAFAGCAASSRPVESSPAVRAFAGADSLHVESLAAGVLHVRAWERIGPWAIHVVEVDTGRCAAQWSARKPQGPLAARAATSSLAAGALVAINADFFQLPGGTPAGVHVTGGRVLIGPGDRPAWLWAGRELTAGTASLEGTVSADDDSLPLDQVNRAVRAVSSYRPPPGGAALFTGLAPAVPPADSLADVVVLQLTGGDESGGEGRVVEVMHARADTLRLAPGRAALQLWGTARTWAARRQVGERVRWRARVLPPGGPAAAIEAVGGFPLLLHDGTDVLARANVTPAFAQRHPRSAIGWSGASGRVFLVAVDGRQVPYSDGMTLAELTELFRRLGATEAINLDGGGSTALAIRGEVQNRPADREGERAVGNALALAGCIRKE